jgi:ubiquinone/menaquinone biosynthesis C-methylase UbiE
MPRIKNQKARDNWIAKRLSDLPNESSLLDVGAGECAYKKHCAHLDYQAQDIAEYDGTGDGLGLQTSVWDTGKLDFICDLYDIPEDRMFDTVFCSEVLEHVVDPVRAVEKMSRLVKPNGKIIITAPFNSLTHFSPYHFCTGFSRFFYEYHLNRLGFSIIELTPNGGFFDMMGQEIGRIPEVRKLYKTGLRVPFIKIFSKILLLNVQLLSALDGPRMMRKSSELQNFGWFVIAEKK